MHVVIIGAGAAGVSAAETIRKHDTTSEITVISKERNLPLSPVALPEYIEGKISKKQLFLWDNKFIKKYHIELILGRTVVSVHQNEKKIIMDDGSALLYDKLLIASGASPILTEDLINRKGVFTLRTLEDAEAIRHQTKERVIIYGAGAVAVKIAIALRKIGIDVIMFCRSRVLRRLFDENICQLIHNLLITNGIKIVGVCDLKRITGDPVERVCIGTQELKCDGMIAALGVTPNTSFLNSQIIRLGPSKGIIVNEKMETSATDIYAAGDCAETKDITSGKSYIMALWPPAVEQGKVATLNMIGIKAIYEGTLPQNVIDIFDTTFVSIGSLDGEKINISKDRAVIRFTVKEGKIIGCQMVGAIENAGLISSCIKKGTTIKDLEHLELIPSGKLLSTIRSFSHIEKRSSKTSL